MGRDKANLDISWLRDESLEQIKGILNGLEENI
jgi:hypothetical protein